MPAVWPALLSDIVNRDREQWREIVNLHDVVNGEAIGIAGCQFRGCEGEGEIAGGRDAVFEGCVQEVLLGRGNDGVSFFLGLGDAFDQDADFFRCFFHRAVGDGAKAVEAEIEIVDNESSEIIATFKSNSATGKYLVSLPAGRNYGIAVKKEAYLFHSENFDIPNTAAFQTVEKDIELKNLAVGSKIILKNIFFDLDKATLRKESTVELKRLT